MENHITIRVPACRKYKNKTIDATEQLREYYKKLSMNNNEIPYVFLEAVDADYYTEDCDNTNDCQKYIIGYGKLIEQKKEYFLFDFILVKSPIMEDYRIDPYCAKFDMIVYDRDHDEVKDAHIVVKAEYRMGRYS